MPRRSRLALAAITGVLAITTLAGCSQTIHLDPAPDADNPACADVTVRLPQAIAGLDRIWTDAQATGAWGDGESSVILACGVEVPGPTSELKCITLEGVDWLVDPAQAPRMRMTTYGRDPAVQVFVDTSKVSGDAVLANRAIVSSIQLIPATGRCIAPDELPDGYKAPTGK